MVLKDWKRTYLGVTLVRYENKKNKKLVFATPLIPNKINEKWLLHLPDKNRSKIDYRGKREVKKAMNAYMRSH